MAKARRKTRQRAAYVHREPMIRPTMARELHNQFRSAGPAVRVIPVIETLANTGKLTPAEFDALDYYRDQAQRAEDDVAQASTLAPERIMGGGSAAPGSRIPSTLLATPAILETARIERDLGSLLALARAIAVDDWSLTRWCIEQHGGRERYDGKGRFVAMVPNRERENMKMALLQLRYAAGMIVR